MDTTNNKTSPIAHIAIIPDGNRRWAKSKGLPPFEGHRKGSENFEKLLYTTRELGIKYCSWWAFSTENWKRTEDENKFLFGLAREYAKNFKKKFLAEKTRFIHIGRKDRIPADIISVLNEIEEETKHFTEFTVLIGLDYGGHDEIIRTIKKLQDQNLEVNDENISKNLDTKDVPPPDLIIRTSGEQRLSGFMSWQCAYSEFYFPKTYFPDFGPEELKAAVKDFGLRDRRFGGDTKTK